MNPYERILHRILSDRASVLDSFRLREELTHRFAWGVPSDEALVLIDQKVASTGLPLVEVGAGKGYWAYLLAEMGVNVRAFDRYLALDAWVEVESGGPETPEDFTDGCNLMLCWPPYRSNLASESLASWLKVAPAGAHLFYVGEGWGGCTGDDDFHRALKQLTPVHTTSLPNWPGIHDRLYVYKRGS